METINMHEAKTRLSNLVERALSGEDVVIAKSGVPMVRLVPVNREETPRTPGRYKGRIRIAADFEEVSAEIARSFEGE